MSSVYHFKPEFGNRRHIELVRHYDERMNGRMPVQLRQQVAGCEPEQMDDHEGTWIFFRTPGLTRLYNHCVVVCPRCTAESDICFPHRKAPIDLDDTEDWQLCGRCGLEFELRDDMQVYVKQEEEA